MNLTEADLHLLPPSMQWLVKTVGLPAVLMLVKKHGGGAPLYVPVKVAPDHPLLHLLGGPAFTTLVAEYGGSHIEIARCEKAVRTLIYRQIRTDRAAGVTQDTVARRYGYTVRTVRIIESTGGVVQEKNLTLF